MKGFLLAAASLLFGNANALPSRPASEPFLTQVDNSTWILGNELWNVTQEQTYGVKLMYKGRDCVGDAVGHYVSYSMCLWVPSQPLESILTLHLTQG